jgi:hypothetical protein
MGNQGPTEQHEAKSVPQITPQQKNGKASKDQFFIEINKNAISHTTGSPPSLI